MATRVERGVTARTIFHDARRGSPSPTSLGRDRALYVPAASGPVSRSQRARPNSAQVTTDQITVQFELVAAPTNRRLAEVPPCLASARAGNQSFEAALPLAESTSFDDISSTRVEKRPGEFAPSDNEPKRS